MKIKGLIWFDEVIDKLASKHNVSQNEVWEVLTSRPRFRFVEKGHRPGENAYAALGQTERRTRYYFIGKGHDALREEKI